jgi:NAD(P)-dependent dehydrogenase (short-subunit alcohol dehydrogenase family)
MSSLQDQIVVITGGSRGFGKAMAVEFQQAGARVAICARHEEPTRAAVQSLPNPGRALGLACDVRMLEQVQALADATVQQFGRIDFWINNAGLSAGWGKLNDIAPERWRESFDTNLIGTYNGCRVALEKMLPNRRGQIMNILGFGADRPAPNQTAYGSAKAAVARLTQSLSIEYGDSGITVSAILPGMIWTEMLTHAEGVNPQMRGRMEWAMRVFGNPPEVPARFVLRIAERGAANGKTYRLLTPRMFVPRMIAEMLGSGKRNPRPWQV